MTYLAQHWQTLSAVVLIVYVATDHPFWYWS